MEKGGKMNNLFLLNQFKNKFNEKVEEKYRINEIENEENTYEFSYGSYNFKINREREVFINSERIFFNDIAIKKNIFQKQIEIQKSFFWSQVNLVEYKILSIRYHRKWL